ncbi:pantoate--beta-alanine ligase [Rhizobium sp. R72]|uniref:pantoate--beta-alanine ligase n=1 Tax=unclassified Rhizobium TaxID=2613769 RepID=UPI000B52E021|nr:MULTISPECIES: pantoate--beta-alanine ligase [unclassified Rhizobium]OWW04813.1 pantoate--beta-alanine ligase [Rhizobium sp. R72]OWW05870.1 pantoate--beta-alanine ligase [Rhizobium sp. R711]
MRIVSTMAELRAQLGANRRDGKTIGFVPTMGFLHVGHLELVSRARAENDVCVVSIFVNPLQFGANEDLSKYPRDLARDSAMLGAAGVDILFAPEVGEMYPRPMLTVVDVPILGNQLEGEVRPGHFAGVATVVTKLFNLVQPDRAYFGEKDYQQVALIKRMVEDLAQPVLVVAVPTVREVDGLACSSRNIYLSDRERAAAVVVPNALAEAERLYAKGCDSPDEMEGALREFIATEPLATPEVVAVRHPETLERLSSLQSAPAVVALFVRIGTTRLLDNRVIGIKSAKNSRAAQ